MGHSDQAMKELSDFEKSLDADAEFDDAVDRAQARLEVEFRAKLSRRDVAATSVIGEAFAGLFGAAPELLLADCATGGQDLQTFLRGVILCHTMNLAKDEVRGRP